MSLQGSDIPVCRRDAHSSIPLLPLHLRSWRNSCGSRSSVRALVMALRWKGCLDVSLLCAAIEMVLCRHEVLRTRFVEIEGVPQQKIDAPSKFDLDIVDLSHLPPQYSEGELRRLARELTRERVDLSLGPLFAARLFRVSTQDHTLVCALDHMIADGASLVILDREIRTLYQQGVHGLPLSLPPLPLQFADYAIWLERTNKVWRAEHEPYWKERLMGAPTFRVPGAVGPSLRIDLSGNGASVEISLGREAAAGLRNLALVERTFLELVVCTAYVATMLRWCDQNDAVLNFVSHGRYLPALQPMIGYVASSLYLRVSLEPQDSFQILLRRLRREFYLGITHQDFERVPDLFPELEFSDLYFNWMPHRTEDPMLIVDPSTGTGIHVQSFTFPAEASVGFCTTFLSANTDIAVRVGYDTALFTRDVVRNYAENLRLFVEQLVSAPSSRIGPYKLDYY